MNWISVNDRMPNDRQECLITNGKKIMHSQWDNEDQKWGSFDHEFHLSFMFGEDFPVITHWQPLPDLPELSEAAEMPEGD